MQFRRSKVSFPIYCRGDASKSSYRRHYVELYVDEARVAIILLRFDDARHVHINDLNGSEPAFGWAVLQRNEAFCSTCISICEWYRQCVVQIEAS